MKSNNKDIAIYLFFVYFLIKLKIYIFGNKLVFLQILYYLTKFETQNLTTAL